MVDASETRSFAPAQKPHPRLRDRTPAERLAALQAAGLLAPKDAEAFIQAGSAAVADGIIENAISTFPVPLGVATNFVMNGTPRLIVMATEERSVIAAASKAAKLARDGFITRILHGTDTSLYAEAQILFAGVRNPKRVVEDIEWHNAALCNILKKVLTRMDKYRGGLRCFRSEMLGNEKDEMVLVTLSIDTGDAMGANVATRMAEEAAVHFQPFTGVPGTAAIVSNGGGGRSVRAEAVWSSKDVPQKRLDGVLTMQRWAELDWRRAATHNKGAMNAVTAVALATGQDTRAIEARVHTSVMGQQPYGPLTSYERCRDGVRGTLQLCAPVGTVGGATGHPVALASRALMGVTDAYDLACLMAAAGLAQNFAALLSLSGEGLTEAHARLKRQRESKKR